MHLVALLACSGPRGPAGPPGDDLWVVLDGEVAWDGEHDVRGVVEVAPGARLAVSGTVRLHPGALLLARGALVAAPGTSFEAVGGLGPTGEQVVVAGDGSVLDGVRVAGVLLRADGDGLDGLTGATFEDGRLEVRDRASPFVLAETAFTGTRADPDAAITLSGTGRVEVRDVTVSGWWIGLSGTTTDDDAELVAERVDVDGGDLGVRLSGRWTVDLADVAVHDVTSGGLVLGSSAGLVTRATVTDVVAGAAISGDGASALAIAGSAVARAAAGISLGGTGAVEDTVVEDTVGVGIVVGDDALVRDVEVRRAGSDCVQVGERAQVLGLLAEECRYAGLTGRSGLVADGVIARGVGTGVAAGAAVTIANVTVEDARNGEGVRVEDGTITGATVLRTTSHGISARDELVVSGARVEDPYAYAIYAGGAATISDAVLLRTGSHGVSGVPLTLSRVRLEDVNGYATLAYEGLVADCVSVARVRDHGLYSTGRATLVDVALADVGLYGVYVASGDLTRVTVERSGSIGVYLFAADPSTVQASAIRQAGYIGLHGTGAAAQVIGVDVVGSASWGLYVLGPVTGSYIADNNGAVGPEPVPLGVIDQSQEASTAQSYALDALVSPSPVPVATGFDPGCGLPP